MFYLFWFNAIWIWHWCNFLCACIHLIVCLLRFYDPSSFRANHKKGKTVVASICVSWHQKYSDWTWRLFRRVSGLAQAKKSGVHFQKLTRSKWQLVLLRWELSPFMTIILNFGVPPPSIHLNERGNNYIILWQVAIHFVCVCMCAPKPGPVRLRFTSFMLMKRTIYI